MTFNKHKEIAEQINVGIKEDKPEIMFSALAQTLLEIEARLSEISTEIAGRGKW